MYCFEVPGDLIWALGRYDTWSFDFLSFKVRLRNRRDKRIKTIFTVQDFQLTVGNNTVLKKRRTIEENKKSKNNSLF
ncbi:hypothetical protein BJH90_12000 [Bacillus halotolerans]|nr:hypothetical protein BJH90_12000 [Bacillus halotolerans]